MTTIKHSNNNDPLILLCEIYQNNSNTPNNRFKMELRNVGKVRIVLKYITSNKNKNII